MANDEHVSEITRGVEHWNQWRSQNPLTRPDLSGADLRSLDLYFRANLRYANLRETDFANANLVLADLRDTDARNANFSHCELSKSSWQRADASGAKFIECKFHRAWMHGGNFSQADFSNASLDVRSAYEAQFTGARLVGFTHARASYNWEETENSPLELAFADGLHAVDADSQKMVADYIDFAFAYWHRDDLLAEEREAFASAIPRIRALQQVFESSGESSSVLISLNQGLLSYFAAHPDKLGNVHWRDFERLVSDLLLANGWNVELTRQTKDGGYDIFAAYTDTLGIRSTWIVECKRWRADRPVGIEVVRSLYAVKTDLRVGGALLATTSNFTAGAHAFKAARYDLELKDRTAILEWISAYGRRKAH